MRQGLSSGLWREIFEPFQVERTRRETGGRLVPSGLGRQKLIKWTKASHGSPAVKNNLAK